MSYKRRFAILLNLIILLSLIPLYSSTGSETILASYKDGKITKKQFKKRLNELPGFYRSKINTDKDKEDFLDQLVIRDIFYKEAVKHGYKDSLKVLKNINDRLKGLLYNKYRTKFIKPKVKITNKEKRDYFVDHSKDKAIFGKTFQEVENYITQKLTPEKEKQLEDKERVKLEKKYKVTYNLDLIKKLNLDKIDENKSLSEKLLVNSPDSLLQKTVGEFIELYKKMPSYRKESIKKKGLENFIKELTKKELFYLEGLKLGLDNDNQIQKEIDRYKENAVLQAYYKDLILKSIPQTDKDVKKYYQDHIKDFSTRAERKVRAFYFKDEKTAKKIRKKVKKLLKKKKEDAIVALLKKYSVYPEKDGVIEHIYKNKIVPGFGKDPIFYDNIWKTPKNAVSPIFKIKKGDYAFIYILEDKPSKPMDFEKIKDRVKSVMRNKLAKQKFKEIKQELYKKYDVKFFKDNIPDKLTAKEYFSKAMDAQNHKRYKDAIFYYDKIIKYYPNNVDDYKATFMKAYIYAENLNDKEKAISLFKKVLHDFKGGELNDSAKFMIDELQGKVNIEKDLENKK